MNQPWYQYVSSFQNLLGRTSIRNEGGEEMDMDQGFGEWVACARAVRDRSGTIFMIGNGASASMASHFSADLAKNAGMHTEVFSDLSLVTAISNDLGYEHVFAEPLRQRGKKSDMLVAISSSGKSKNILSAVDVGRSLGLVIVTLSAMNPENPLRKTGFFNVYVPVNTYGLAESCHAAILHYWMDLVQEACG